MNDDGFNWDRQMAKTRKSPEYRKLANDRIKFQGGRCYECGNAEQHLMVHHLAYSSSGDAADVHLSDVIALCGDCERRRTDAYQAMQELVPREPTDHCKFKFVYRYVVEQVGLALVTKRAQVVWPGFPDNVDREVESDKKVVCIPEATYNELVDAENYAWRCGFAAGVERAKVSADGILRQALEELKSVE